MEGPEQPNILVAAYAVMESENTDSSKWFIDLLVKDLELMIMVTPLLVINKRYISYFLILLFFHTKM